MKKKKITLTKDQKKKIDYSLQGGVEGDMTDWTANVNRKPKVVNKFVIKAKPLLTKMNENEKLMFSGAMSEQEEQRKRKILSDKYDRIETKFSAKDKGEKPKIQSKVSKPAKPERNTYMPISNYDWKRNDKKTEERTGERYKPVIKKLDTPIVKLINSKQPTLQKRKK